MRIMIKYPIVLALIFIFGCNFEPPTKNKSDKKTTPIAVAPPADYESEEVFLQTAVKASGVAIVIKNNEFKTLCSVFVLDKVEDKYRFITTAHCVQDYGEEAEVDLSEYQFSIRTEAENNEINYVSARALVIGDKKELRDILILEGESAAALPTLSLSQIGPELGEEVYLITMRQFELGAQVFQGYVSRKAVSQDVIIGAGTLNLKGVMTLHIPALGIGQGASGSAVISRKTHKVIGIFFASSEYGNRDHITHLVIPVEKINSFYNQVK